ncbi:MAG TPA: prepilin-type N-terminal cleavage/methylation domain-containing protein [Planctomycetes bacterium]|nr:prepilin-type N-terminal cleavage/methylation domain-containing protein [Planctomycetota bacterium]HIN80611.1 prepilin-type N-terminal cleavage/methylation domain-containing protein [Planctomycetota bacterium]
MLFQPKNRGVGDRSQDLSPEGGFTLIELMIVIAIIAVLAGLVTKGIGLAQAKAQQAEAINDINTVLFPSLQAFKSDMGAYPGWDKSPTLDDIEEFNSFPDVYEALCGRRPPAGRGGRNAPYVELKLDKVVVEDEDGDLLAINSDNDVIGAFRKADREEQRDPDTEKFYIDPWGYPYIYRENGSKRRKEDWMIKESSFDLWSIGPDGINSACEGPDFDEESDDIGNW